MTYLIYDGAYEGFLTAVFETYRLKLDPVRFVAKGVPPADLFAAVREVETCKEKSDRVKKGLLRKTSAGAAELLHHAFFTEVEEMEQLIYGFIRKAMVADQDITENFADPDVLRLHELKKQMHREIHRLHAFVRFQKLQDDSWFALVAPDFNVLPLAWPHFHQRYPAQRWLIYDQKRRFGVLNNLQKVDFFFLSPEHHRQLLLHFEENKSTDERGFQRLWQQYFTSVNIPERANPKLHLQHVPKRYWRFLTEKWATD